jgi:hypothetical protein
MLIILLKKVTDADHHEMMNQDEFQAWLKAKETVGDPTNDLD